MKDIPFEDRYIPEPNSGCWLWLGEINDKGYGRVWAESMRMRAHRYSYQHHVGLIPDGLHVCHRCDVPCCVNPDHLFLGTASDNMRDCVRKGRHKSNLRKKVQGDSRPGRPRSPSTRRHLAIEEVIEIRALRGKLKLRDIAPMYGVHYSTIGNILNGISWSHVK